jgi:hypothetical protein
MSRFFVLVVCACVALCAAQDQKTLENALSFAFTAYCGSGVSRVGCCGLLRACLTSSQVDASFSCFWCKQTPFADFTWLANFGSTTSSAAGFVGYSVSTRQVVVSWRGTDNLPGWIADAEFGQMGYPGAPPGIRVHTGFFQSANGVAGHVRQLVSFALARCGVQCSVMVTGHSLGAALATLSAVDLALFNGIRAPIDLYVFGSPRVGNSVFVAWFQQVLSAPRGRIRNVARVTNGGDPVAHLPPRSFFGVTSYSHIAREVWHTSAGYKLCNMSGEDPTCGDSVSTFDMNALDHGKYMGKSAIDGVLHRCMWTDPQTK